MGDEARRRRRREQRERERQEAMRIAEARRQLTESFEKYDEDGLTPPSPCRPFSLPSLLSVPVTKPHSTRIRRRRSCGRMTSHAAAGDPSVRTSLTVALVLRFTTSSVHDDLTQWAELRVRMSWVVCRVRAVPAPPPGGGTLDREEFAFMLADMGCPIAGDEFDDIFNAIDADGGGDIDVDEFCDYFVSAEGGAMMACVSTVSASCPLFQLTDPASRPSERRVLVLAPRTSYAVRDRGT